MIAQVIHFEQISNEVVDLDDWDALDEIVDEYAQNRRKIVENGLLVSMIFLVVIATSGLSLYYANKENSNNTVRAGLCLEIALSSAAIYVALRMIRLYQNLGCAIRAYSAIQLRGDFYNTFTAIPLQIPITRAIIESRYCAYEYLLGN
jgi:hypothetical protein